MAESPYTPEADFEAEATMKETQADVDRLMNDLSTLRRDFAAIADTVRDMAMARGEQGRATVEDYMVTARGQAEDYVNQAETYVRANPITAVGAAFGVGWLIGRLMSRD